MQFQLMQHAFQPGKWYAVFGHRTQHAQNQGFEVIDAVGLAALDATHKYHLSHGFFHAAQG